MMPTTLKDAQPQVILMPPEQLFDVATFDLSKVIADKEAIRKLNPQRYEMEHLDAIVYLDPVNHVIVGYKDVTDHEFWARGHMPGYPLMPGVIMCEAGAQLANYYMRHQNLMGGDFIGFGGLDKARFRAPVRPGDRLVMIAKAIKIHRRQTLCNVQGYVGETMAFHAEILGVPITRKEEAPKGG